MVAIAGAIAHTINFRCSPALYHWQVMELEAILAVVQEVQEVPEVQDVVELVNQRERQDHQKRLTEEMDDWSHIFLQSQV